MKKEFVVDRLFLEWTERVDEYTYAHFETEQKMFALILGANGFLAMCHVGYYEDDKVIVKDPAYIEYLQQKAEEVDV